MNDVASETIKWQDIGLQLELKHVDIDTIATEESNVIQNCFRRVFDLWERRCTCPYTWETLIAALETPSVHELSLARNLKQKYLHHSIEQGK